MSFTTPGEVIRNHAPQQRQTPEPYSKRWAIIQKQAFNLVSALIDLGDVSEEATKPVFIAFAKKVVNLNKATQADILNLANDAIDYLEGMRLSSPDLSKEALLGFASVWINTQAQSRMNEQQGSKIENATVGNSNSIQELSE